MIWAGKGDLVLSDFGFRHHLTMQHLVIDWYCEVPLQVLTDAEHDYVKGNRSSIA
jgi:hypothetical protein